MTKAKAVSIANGNAIGLGEGTAITVSASPILLPLLQKLSRNSPARLLQASDDALDDNSDISILDSSKR